MPSNHHKKLPTYILTGLQFQRDQGGGEQAIEHVLEQAIYKAGLLLGTNVGQSHRTGWSRSSRTDAGVHSVSTVSSMSDSLHNMFFAE